MRILVVGATGTIGRAIVAALSPNHEVVSASRQSTAIKVDLADPVSIREMFRSAGKLDAVVCAAGQAKFAPLDPSQGLPAAVVAKSYLRSVTGGDNGSVLEPSR